MSMNTPYGSVISTKKIQDFESVNVLNTDQNILAVKNVIDNAGIKITLQDLLNSMKSNQANNALQIGSDNKLYVSNLQSDIDNRAKTDLSNITQDGVNKIKQEAQVGVGEALDVQNMYTTGILSTDSRGFEQVKEMKRSTFDRSKFTVVGNPTITDDGIASGFRNGNYIRVSNTNINSSANNFSIKLKFNLISKGYLFSEISSNNKFYIMIDDDRKLRVMLKDETDTNYIANYRAGVTTLSLNTNYKVELKYTGTHYLVNLTNLDTGNTTEELNIQSSLKIYNGNNLSVGVRGADYIVPLDGSIDLSQFSISVDGVEIFNGNKTGIDQIKKDDYTVVGTPTITDDGIASGFNDNNYLTIPLNVQATDDVDFEFEWEVHEADWSGAKVILGGGNNIARGTFQIYHYSNSCAIGAFVNKDNIATLVNTAFTTNINLAGKYKVHYNKIGTNYSITLFKPNGTSETKSITGATGYNLSLNSTQSIGRDVNTNTTVDLNLIKLYSNGNLVYQPTLRIPYTQSKTGSKIVDATYRDRVQDVYEQFGQANYYTLLDGEKYNVTKVGNPALVGGVASGFSSNDYLQCPISFNKPFRIKVSFTFSNSTHNQYIFISKNRGLQFLINTINQATIYAGTTAWDNDIIKLERFTQLTPNVEHNLDFIYNGSNYKINIDNQEVANIDKSSQIFADTTLEIGKYLTQNLTGSIDLSQFSITVDGKEVFRGYESNNFTLPMGEIYGMLNNLEIKKQDKCIHIIDTYVNGTSGYRIWSDGYCEQWGYIDSTTVYQANCNISLAKTFKDTNYNLSICYKQKETSGGVSFRENGWKTKSTNKFEFGLQSSSSYTLGADWKACGYLADGQY